MGEHGKNFKFHGVIPPVIPPISFKSFWGKGHWQFLFSCDSTHPLNRDNLFVESF